MADDFELLREFFVADAREIFRLLEAPVLELGRNPGDREIAAEVFRRVHSLKGMAATVGYQPMTQLAHTLEELLDRLRKGTLTPTPAVVEAISAGIDQLAQLVDDFAAWRPGVVPRALHPEGWPGEDHPATLQGGGRVSPREPAGDADDDTIRVGVRYLDRLYDLAGRLVAGQARVEARLGGLTDADLREALAAQTRTVRELRDAVLEVRLLPAHHLFARFPRLVRDLARRESKEVGFVVAGEATRVDRAVLERLAEPLTHLLRNAVHHGVESPAERERLGKPGRAVVRLSASRERGQAVIAVADDGRGLDPDALARRAVGLGLLSAAEASRLDELSRRELIFRPGFSTEADVSDVSGRGVGLDVVARAVSAVGGSVEVDSTPGSGTSFVLRVPISIAFAAALLVEAAGEVFALPVAGLTAAAEGTELPRTASLADLLALPPTPIAPSTGPTRLVIESGGRRAELVVDRALRVEEIVVRPLGKLLARYPGLSGATVLGDGRVVPILDTAELVRWAVEAAERGEAPAEA